MRAQRRTRVLIFGTVGAVAVAVTLAVYAAHVLRSLELKTVDTRFVLRGPQGAPSDVAVVQIDDVTFNDLRNSNRPAQWPFSRCYHASVIDRIAKAAPRAIAVDIQFTEPSSSAACDNKLIEAVGRAGNVVLATTEVDAERPHGHLRRRRRAQAAGRAAGQRDPPCGPRRRHPPRAVRDPGARRASASSRLEVASRTASHRRSSGRRRRTRGSTSSGRPGRSTRTRTRA